MKISWRRCSALVPLLVVILLASCSLPVDRPPQAPAVPSKLSPANEVFDIEQEELKVLWPHELGQLTANRRLRDIYCAGRKVVIEAQDGEIHVLNALTGEWEATTVLRDKLSRAPVALGDTLILIVGNTLFAYDTAEDALSEGYNPGFALFTPPQLFRDGLILAGGNGHLAFLTLTADKQTYLASLDGPIFEQPVITGGRLYAAASGDKVIAWDLDNQVELWRWRPPDPSVISTGVAVYDNRVYVGDSRGIVYSLKTDYGQQTWQRMVGAPVTGKLAVVESKLLVFTNKPNVVCLEAGEGRQELWQYAGAKELLAVGKEVVYLLTDDHSVAAVSIETGEERWRDPLPPDCKVVGDPQRPVLYLANSGGSIVALAELD